MTDIAAFTCFVFDFDGTLYQSNTIKRQVFFAVAERYVGGHETMFEILEDRSLDRYQIFDKFIRQIGRGKPESLAAEYSQACYDQILGTPEVPGALSLLSRLKELGRFVFINSATPEIDLKKTVAALKLLPLVDGVMGRPRSKEDNLSMAMAKANVAAAQTVMIGDGESDRAAAAAIGCSFIAVRNEFNDFSVPPVEIFDDLQPLADGMLG